MTHVKNFAGSLSLICGSLFLQAQVAVRFEPRHKVALENEWVRLLDVRLAPGDTSLFHIHEIPSYFIPLSNTAIGSEVKGQSPQESKVTIGATWYNGFENGPLIHKVWNRDTNVLHVIDLELLSNQKTTLPRLELSKASIDFENEKLRAYKVQITNNSSINLSSSKTPMIIISLSGPEINVQNANKKDNHHVKAGGFQWLEAGGSFLINTNENVAAAALLIWLK